MNTKLKLSRSISVASRLPNKSSFKVREAEREKVVADYESRLLSLINGTVKKVTRDSVIVDLGGAAEALMPRENLIGAKFFRSMIEFARFCRRFVPEVVARS